MRQENKKTNKKKKTGVETGVETGVDVAAVIIYSSNAESGSKITDGRQVRISLNFFIPSTISDIFSVPLIVVLGVKVPTKRVF
jgi:hypothetical protein